eukprot:gnl/Hemi2/12086_TR4124_c0_g5_i1.p1 gnl/Hemi2/12086_TR4124_c0_g5~~gnl/Hemi2/12086_TR4124_c0_g5_i1.p1  ORF type:complete len:122 (-),score=11.38 gnl/Hemi2/12086_TR4124_c0_g5_i1:456-821(-)
MPNKSNANSPTMLLQSQSFSSCVSTARNGSVRIQIHAKPGAKRSGITDVGAEVGVQLVAPPRDGEANDELVRFMAEVLGVHRRSVTFEAGSRSRNKVICVEGLTEQVVLSKLRVAGGLPRD